MLGASQKYVVDDDMKRAVTQHQEGNLDAAALLYCQVLQREPKQFDALHLLSVIELQRGEIEKAEALIRSALKLQPANVDVLVGIPVDRDRSFRFVVTGDSGLS